MSVQDVTIPKRYVYTQATTPTGATEGSLWYNTASKILKTYDGSTWSEVTTDLTSLEQQQLEQNINILINSASASSILNDYDEMFLDVFSDSTGYDNTIDIGNTTASFVTDQYVNGGSETTLNSGFILNTTAGDTNLGGYGISVDVTCELKSVTKSSECTGTTAYLRATPTGANIATASMVGNTATFSPTQTLTQGQNYAIMVGSGGSGYTRDIQTSISYPVDGTHINLTGGVWSSTDVPESTVAKNIDNIVTVLEPSDKIVQTNAISVITGVTNHQVYCHNTTAGTGAITYDMSFDNGSTWDVDQELNTKNIASSTTGTQMIIKLNLDGIGEGNTSFTKDYAVMLYY